MVKENVRERENANISNTDDSVVYNTTKIANPDRARQTVMDRYNQGESIIQPPESTGLKMGDEIRAQLASDE